MSVLKVDFENAKVTEFESVKQATNAGNTGTVIKSEQDIIEGHATTKQLVALYNKFSTKPVKKFTDRKTAAKRLWAILADEATDFHAPNEPGPVVTPMAKPKSVAAKSTRGRTGNRGKYIYPIDGPNPFRKGGKSYETYEVITKTPGKTFGQYVAEGGRANAISGALRNGWLIAEEDKR